MPKCKKCGLEVRRNKYGEWEHVAAGHFAHSAEPVDLGGPRAQIRPVPARSAATATKARPAPKAPAKPKFRVTKYLQKKHRKKGRLPDRSAFELRYDAAKKEWTGSLIVLGHTAFTGRHAGVFRLLELLDDQYRLALAGADSPHPGK